VKFFFFLFRLASLVINLKEEDGDIGAAADVLQEVHVETYGSLSKKEKVEFILEQLRLTLGKQDFVRAAIVAGKINRKHLAEMKDYKVRFFTLLSTLHRHEKNAFELVKDYHAIYTTIQDDEENVMAWKEALQSAVVFLALSPYGNEQQDLMNRIQIDKNLKKVPACQ
jgi:26S proteasome regulatory subunit N5